MIVITICREEVTLIVVISIYYIIGSSTLMFDWQAYLNSIGLPMTMISFNEKGNNLQYKWKIDITQVWCVNCPHGMIHLVELKIMGMGIQVCDHDLS